MSVSLLTLPPPAAVPSGKRGRPLGSSCPFGGLGGCGRGVCGRNNKVCFQCSEFGASVWCPLWTGRLGQNDLEMLSQALKGRLPHQEQTGGKPRALPPFPGLNTNSVRHSRTTLPNSPPAHGMTSSCFHIFIQKQPPANMHGMTAQQAAVPTLQPCAPHTEQLGHQQPGASGPEAPTPRSPWGCLSFGACGWCSVSEQTPGKRNPSASLKMVYPTSEDHTTVLGSFHKPPWGQHLVPPTS